jgi:hypothetical protein
MMLLLRRVALDSGTPCCQKSLDHGTLKAFIFTLADIEENKLTGLFKNIYCCISGVLRTDTRFRVE